MKPLIDHRIIQSFLLFLDNQILSKGEAFKNHSGLFYRVNTPYSGYTAYSSPFRSFVSDKSISGANVMTGVYINNLPVTINESGLKLINYELGTIYFTGNIPTNSVISGNYAIKDFNIYYTQEPEFKLLFENKYVINSKFNQVLSGLASDIKTIPAIFVKPVYEENRPFAFNRLDDNTMDFRCVVIADNEFNKIGACNLLKNLNFREFPLVMTGIPLNNQGCFTGQTYSYSGLVGDTGKFPLITETRVININTQGINSSNLIDNLSISHAIVDIRINTIMNHG